MNAFMYVYTPFTNTGAVSSSSHMITGASFGLQ